MMHRCGGDLNMVAGGCACGVYHTTRGNSFPMRFSKNKDGYLEFDEGEMCCFVTNSPPSPVDCTLSLGTPSTRLSDEKNRFSCMPAGFGRKDFPSKHKSLPPSTVRGGSNGHSGRDPLLARQCADCDTTSTPLWRNGPRGPKSLCNACGIRFKKEERRATATAAMNEPWTPPQKTPCYPSSHTKELRFAEEDDNRNSSSWGFKLD